MYQYLWYFVFFSFAGWLAEIIFTAHTQKKFVNRGFLNGPFCPIYGFAMSLAILAAKPVFPSIVLVFVVTTIVTTVFELAAGYLLKAIFHAKWWDYSHMPANFKGYICVPFSLLWGLSGTFLILLFLPILDRAISHIPHEIGWIILICILGFIVCDFVVTSLTLFKLHKQIKTLDSISKNIPIKHPVDKLDENEIACVDNTEELEQRYYATLNKTNVLKRRVVKAFPHIRSTKYTEQLEAFKQASIAFRRRNMEEYEDHYLSDQERPFAYGLNYTKLFWLFLIGSVVGCLLEECWAIFVTGKFEIRVGLVYGPFVPIYGGGAVIITLCLYRLYKAKDIWIFIASGFLGAGFEYLCSYLQELLFGTVSWDYSNTPFNIGGRTNLMFGLIWGVLGLLWVRDIYPVISRTIEKIPKKIGRILTICLSILMILDILLSCAAIIRQNERRQNIPATNIFQQFLDEHLDDDYLKLIFPNMEYVDSKSD